MPQPTVKKRKADVDYGPGKSESRCGVCIHYDPVRHTCRLVEGYIEADKWCRLFEAAR